MRRVLILAVFILLSFSLWLNWQLYQRLSALQTAEQADQGQTMTLRQLLTVLDNYYAVESAPNNQAEDRPESEAMGLFAGRQYEEAIDAYADLLAIDEVAATELRDVFLRHAKQWQSQQSWHQLSQFILIYLDRFPFDTEFLALKAQLQLAQGKVQEAFDNFYTIVSLELEETDKDLWRQRIHQHFTRLHSEMKLQQAWSRIVNLSRQLLWHEVDYPPYIFALSHALMKLGEVDQAKQVVLPLLDDVNYGLRAERLIEEIERITLEDQVIPLQTYGEHFIVRGSISDGYGGELTIDLMIDTGASLSVLTQSTFAQLREGSDVRYIRQVRINTAGGVLESSVYRIAEFQVGDVLAENIEFVVFPMDEADEFNGLLGMNFLKQYRFQIDQQNQLLLLSSHLN